MRILDLGDILSGSWSSLEGSAEEIRVEELISQQAVQLVCCEVDRRSPTDWLAWRGGGGVDREAVRSQNDVTDVS